MADAHDSPETPFPIAPSPWDDLKADVFATVGWASVSDGLPVGSFGPLEENSSFSDPEASGEFKGGLCSVMILRYHQTPVGPYDEVIWIPGSFEVPHLDRNEMMRIGRIYVSSLASVYNGRRNWNIPKQLAHFTFHPSDTQNPPYKKIEASLPETPNEPFISVDLTPIPLLSRPSIPISTSYIPINMDLGMPPLPESENWKEDGQAGSPGGKWHAARATISGWSGMVGVDGKIGNKDGEGFPKLKMGGSWFWIKDAKVAFETVDEDYELE